MKRTRKYILSKGNVGAVVGILKNLTDMPCEVTVNSEMNTYICAFADIDVQGERITVMAANVGLAGVRTSYVLTYGDNVEVYGDRSVCITCYDSMGFIFRQLTIAPVFDRYIMIREFDMNTLAVFLELYTDTPYYIGRYRLHPSSIEVCYTATETHKKPAKSIAIHHYLIVDDEENKSETADFYTVLTEGDKIMFKGSGIRLKLKNKNDFCVKLYQP